MSYCRTITKEEVAAAWAVAPADPTGAASAYAVALEDAYNSQQAYAAANAACIAARDAYAAVLRESLKWDHGARCFLIKIGLRL